MKCMKEMKLRLNSRWSMVDIRLQLWTMDYRLWTYCLLLTAYCLLFSCTPKNEKLPILGSREWNGKDTIYHTIAPFQFVDQDSTLVTNSTFKDKIYVADFFFTSCRTICPIMKTQMLRAYEATQNIPDVLLLSHSIDPENDTVA